MKKLGKEDAINILLFTIFLLLGAYFIFIETWLLPVKILIFVVLVVVLKSVFFQRSKKL